MMPTLYNPRPMDELKRASVAIEVASEKLNSVRLLKEVMYNFKEGRVVSSNRYDISPLVRVTSDCGESHDVCPWCRSINPSETLNKNGLFYHGTCSRPCWKYSPAECGQPDYDAGF